MRVGVYEHFLLTSLPLSRLPGPIFQLFSKTLLIVLILFSVSEEYSIDHQLVAVQNMRSHRGGSVVEVLPADAKPLVIPGTHAVGGRWSWRECCFLRVTFSFSLLPSVLLTLCPAVSS